MKKLLSGLLLLSQLGLANSRTADIDFADGIYASRSYVKNGNAEKKGVKDLSAYADAAGAAPVDGTGGSPTVTCTRTTSSPLAGDGSFLITHDAANRQGEGCSIPIAIDSVDQAKVIQINFDYAIASGTFAGGTDAAVGDLAFYVYDVTNATIIQPSSYKVLGSVSGQFYKHLATFQTASNSTSYRLIWHVATTTATAWTFKLDNIKAGPQITSFGAPITDYQSYTPTIYGTTTNPTKASGATEKAYWRRSGDSVEILYSYKQSATTGANSGSGTYVIGLPSGMAIDTTKIQNDTGSSEQGLCGSTAFRGNAVTTQATGNAFVFDNGAGKAGVVLYGTVEAGGNLTDVGSGSYGYAGNAILQMSFTCKIPILGWASSVQMSSDTDTRVVSASLYRASSTQTSSAGTPLEVVFNTSRYDTHGSCSTSTGRCTAVIPGYYDVSFGIRATMGATAASQFDAYILKNGTGDTLAKWSETVFTNNGRYNPVGTTRVYLNAGDYVSIWTVATTQAVTVGNTSGSDDVTYMSFTRASGPASIAASDKIAFFGYPSTTNNTGFNPNGSQVKININSVTPVGAAGFDTHGTFVSGSSRWVPPRQGIYNISACVEFLGSNVLASAYQAQIAVGASIGVISGSYFRPVVSTPFSVCVSGALKLTPPNDYVELYVYGAGNNSSSTLTYFGPTTFLSITSQ